MYYFVSIEVCISKPAICCTNYKGLIASLTFKISRDEACFVITKGQDTAAESLCVTLVFMISLRQVKELNFCPKVCQKVIKASVWFR